MNGLARSDSTLAGARQLVGAELSRRPGRSLKVLAHLRLQTLGLLLVQQCRHLLLVEQRLVADLDGDGVLVLDPDQKLDIGRKRRDDDDERTHFAVLSVLLHAHHRVQVRLRAETLTLRLRLVVVGFLVVDIVVVDFVAIIIIIIVADGFDRTLQRRREWVLALRRRSILLANRNDGTCVGRVALGIELRAQTQPTNLGDASRRVLRQR